MLSDEEKKAIKEVKHFNELTRYWQEEEYEEKEIARYIRTILNLIEKQSKEIELLKEENEKYKNPPFFDEENYTSKDKIKAKIEEIDKILERNLLVDSLRDYFEAQKEVLQSLLEKE